MSEKKEEKIEQKPQQIGSLVFISHDTRDAEIAEAFSLLLKRVSAGVLKSFRSSDKKGNQGIEFGVEWYPEILENIRNATDVVCLLTPNSVNRPWILFEAGMAKGKLDTPILGIALGITLKAASTGPFAQFQNCKGDEDSLCKLVFQLVDRIPNSEPDEETIKFHVQKFIASMEEIFSNRKSEPEDENSGELTENDTAKLFEEIKVMFQDLPARIDRNVSTVNRKRMRHIHPELIEELSYLSKGNKHFGFLVLISLYRDEMPWIYEIGKETYDILKSNKAASTKEKAISNFRRIIKNTAMHPIFHEMFGSKESMMMLDKLTYITDKYLRRFIIVEDE